MSAIGSLIRLQGNTWELHTSLSPKYWKAPTEPTRSRSFFLGSCLRDTAEKALYTPVVFVSVSALSASDPSASAVFFSVMAWFVVARSLPQSAWLWLGWLALLLLLEIWGSILGLSSCSNDALLPKTCCANWAASSMLSLLVVLEFLKKEAARALSRSTLFISRIAFAKFVAPCPSATGASGSWPALVFVTLPLIRESGALGLRDSFPSTSTSFSMAKEPERTKIMLSTGSP
mmetsp:Transcript_98827/g.235597  ORF Transcript_98827/g.235597 Transcript_98827/m.235597 type:complete len:232 (-) Transcript_98827:710-1405(-)